MTYINYKPNIDTSAPDYAKVVRYLNKSRHRNGVPAKARMSIIIILVAMLISLSLIVMSNL